MKTLLLAFVGTFLSAQMAFAAQDEAGCDLPNVKWMGELQMELGRRAVDVVSRAAVSHGGRDIQLEQMVEPGAKFSLGAGDVGGPLPDGVVGAIALADMMNADSYRFFGWNDVPSPVEDLCGTHKIKVEFTNTEANLVHPVLFTFKRGRIVSAEGWALAFRAGAVSTP